MPPAKKTSAKPAPAAAPGKQLPPWLQKKGAPGAPAAKPGTPAAKAAPGKPPMKPAAKKKPKSS